VEEIVREREPIREIGPYELSILKEVRAAV
jgi:hypothetical protein